MNAKFLSNFALLLLISFNGIFENCEAATPTKEKDELVVILSDIQKRWNKVDEGNPAEIKYVESEIGTLLESGGREGPVGTLVAPVKYTFWHLAVTTVRSTAMQTNARYSKRWAKRSEKYYSWVDEFHEAHFKYIGGSPEEGTEMPKEIQALNQAYKEQDEIAESLEKEIDNCISKGASATTFLALISNEKAYYTAFFYLGYRESKITSDPSVANDRMRKIDQLGLRQESDAWIKDFAQKRNALILKLRDPNLSPEQKKAIDSEMAQNSKIFNRGFPGAPKYPDQDQLDTIRRYQDSLETLKGLKGEELKAAIEKM